MHTCTFLCMCVHLCIMAGQVQAGELRELGRQREQLRSLCHPAPGRAYTPTPPLNDLSSKRRELEFGCRQARREGDFHPHRHQEHQAHQTDRDHQEAAKLMPPRAR
jgi:hypothetical protein